RAVSEGARGIAPARRRRQLPACRGVDGYATDLIFQRRVAEIIQRVAINEGTKLGRERSVARDPSIRVHRYARRREMGRLQLDRAGYRVIKVHEPLASIDEVRGDV